METLSSRPAYQKTLGSVFLIDICCCGLLFANALDNPSTPIEAFTGLVSYSLTVVAVILIQLVSCVLNIFGSYLHVTESRSALAKRAARISMATLTIGFLLIFVRGANDRFTATGSVEIATNFCLALTMTVSHIYFIFALKPDGFRFRFDKRNLLHFTLFTGVVLVGTSFLFDTLPDSNSIRSLGLLLVALWRANALGLLLLSN